MVKKRLRDMKAQCAEENGPCSLGPQRLIPFPWTITMSFSPSSRRCFIYIQE